MRIPTWPGGESGVTIGIGYDLGFTSKQQIEADWDPFLEKPERAALAAVQGAKGAVAGQLARGLRHIRIPLAAAEPVFYASTLPRFARITRDAFPGVEKLPLDAQGALLSLVFNRGASCAGERRREMRAIRDELAGGALARAYRGTVRGHAKAVARCSRTARPARARGWVRARREAALSRRREGRPLTEMKRRTPRMRARTTG